MLKRRKLTTGQDVVIIHHHLLSFIKEPAIFLRYQRIMLGSVSHETPVFKFRDHELNGLECFWLLPEYAVNDDHVLYVQKQLISLQIKALEIAKEMGYHMPEKIKDKDIRKAAVDNADRMKHIVEKLGFDPRDESWIEAELAANDRERNWFKFERENNLLFSDLPESTKIFNEQYKDNLSLDQSRNISKKRMRYLMGAHFTRMSGNGNKQDWVKAAKEFEEYHRDIEQRMMTWSLLHRDKFPVVKTKEPVRFWAGPYFHQFLEKCPQLFVDGQLKYVKPGVFLRVISYDTKHKYIRLDFLRDVRNLIKPDEADGLKIWVKDRADYDLWVKPEEIEMSLEILEPLA